jgi:hypothetical protein
MWLLILAIMMIAWWRKERLGRRAAARESRRAREPPSRPVAAITALAAAYAVFTAWMFVAWYRKHRPLARYKWGGDGWMGVSTYAGGADKFGHAWATMALARLGTAILADIGGFARRKASLVSAGLSQLLFTGVEVRDGTYYEFSFSDLTGDICGAIVAALLDNFPRLNELFAFRVEYWPSEMYKRKLRGTSPCRPESCSRWNAAEDYSGETYLAAFHLAGISGVYNRIGAASRFVDVVVGFDSRNYRPDPDPDVTARPRQELFLGLAVNAQGFLDWLLEERESPAARRVRKVAHGLFEVFNLPNGSVRLASASRAKPLRPAPASSLDREFVTDHA